MKKEFAFGVFFLLITNLIFAEGLYDTDFQLKNYNRSLAVSYSELIVSVNLGSPIGIIPFTMFDSYTVHNGNVDKLVSAYLLGVQTKHGLPPFRSAGSVEPINQDITSAALRNNKDTIAFITVSDISVGVSFYFYDRDKRQWFKSFYQSFF